MIIIVALISVMSFVAGYKLAKLEYVIYKYNQEKSINDTNKKIKEDDVKIVKEFDSKKFLNEQRRNERITSDTSKDTIQKDSIDFINK